MAAKTSDEILRRVDDTLATAKLGLRDVLKGGPERRLGGLRNLIVFGRAVTNVLQNLRSTEQTFDAWYDPYVNEMREDPLLKYFYDLRSEILKEGQLRTSSGLYIKSFSYLDRQRLGPPPPGAKRFSWGTKRVGVAGRFSFLMAPPKSSISTCLATSQAPKFIFPTRRRTIAADPFEIHGWKRWQVYTSSIWKRW